MLRLSAEGFLPDLAPIPAPFVGSWGTPPPPPPCGGFDKEANPVVSMPCCCCCCCGFPPNRNDCGARRIPPTAVLGVLVTGGGAAPLPCLFDVPPKTFAAYAASSVPQGSVVSLFVFTSLALVVGVWEVKGRPLPPPWPSLIWWRRESAGVLSCAGGGGGGGSHGDCVREGCLEEMAVLADLPRVEEYVSCGDVVRRADGCGCGCVLPLLSLLEYAEDTPRGASRLLRSSVICRRPVFSSIRADTWCSCRARSSGKSYAPPPPLLLVGDPEL